MVMRKLTYKNIAKLVKTKREEVRPLLSQTQLALKIGLTTGQSISQIERSLCSFPQFRAPLLCEILNVTKYEIWEAINSDGLRNFERHFKREAPNA